MDNQNPSQMAPQDPSVQTPPPQPPIQQTSPVETEPVAQTSPPSTPKPFLSGKILLIFIVLLILLGAGGTYLALNSKPKPQPVVSKATPTSTPTPAPDPTASWKTYKNETYSYSLKIPNDWVIDFNNAKENNDKLVFIYSGDLKDAGDTQVQVPHLGKGSQLEISVTIYKSYDDLRPSKGEYPDEGKEIMVDGEKAMLWTSNNAYSISGQRGYNLCVLHNGKGYTMLIISMISALPQDLLFSQILSTFRFD